MSSVALRADNGAKASSMAGAPGSVRAKLEWRSSSTTICPRSMSTLADSWQSAPPAAGAALPRSGAQTWPKATVVHMRPVLDIGQILDRAVAFRIN